MSAFPEYEEAFLREKYKEPIKEFYLLRDKLDRKEFTEREIEYHGGEPLDETDWDSLITGFFIGKGLTVAEATTLAIYIY